MIEAETYSAGLNNNPRHFSWRGLLHIYLIDLNRSTLLILGSGRVFPILPNAATSARKHPPVGMWCYRAASLNEPAGAAWLDVFKIVISEFNFFDKLLTNNFLQFIIIVFRVVFTVRNISLWERRMWNI